MDVKVRVTVEFGPVRLKGKRKAAFRKVNAGENGMGLNFLA